MNVPTRGRVQFGWIEVFAWGHTDFGLGFCIEWNGAVTVTLAFVSVVVELVHT